MLESGYETPATKVPNTKCKNS